MTHKILLDETFQLIKKLSPMIPPDKIDEFEKEHGLGKFDVMFLQKEGQKTIWGGEKIDFNQCTLRELANNIYDCLYDDYEVWIRETPMIANESSTISDKWIRYAISLEADNMDEDDAILSCRLVSGWLVISALYDATPKQKFRFYTALGMNHRTDLGPNDLDQNRLIHDQLWALTVQQIRKYPIIRSTGNASCSHCDEQLKIISKQLEPLGDDLDELWEENLKSKKALDAIKDHITKKEYNEKSKEWNKLFIFIKKQLEFREEKRKELDVVIENSKSLYVCNVCGKTVCTKLIQHKRVCLECRNNIFDKIAKKKDYDLDF